MVAVTHGADVAALHQLGLTLTTQVGAVADILTAGAAVETTPWVGPARERFLEQWNTQFKTTLESLQTAFTAAGKECTTRAQQLEMVMGLGAAGGGATNHAASAGEVRPV